MTPGRKISLSGINRKLRTQFFAGVLIVVPIIVAIYILRWLFLTIDGILQPTLQTLLGYAVPGLGIAVTLAVIYLTGVVATCIVGRRVISFIESLLARVPLFRYLYTSIRQIMQSFTAPSESRFLHVVLVEFPKKGMRAIGFVTTESRTDSGEKLLSVFIPTSPNPTSGYLEIVKESDVIRTDISVDDALKVVLSAGKVSLKEITYRLGVEGADKP